MLSCINETIQFLMTMEESLWQRLEYIVYLEYFQQMWVF